MISVLDSLVRASGPGSRSRSVAGDILCCVLEQDTFTVPLSTQVCKLLLANLILGGNHATRVVQGGGGPLARFASGKN